MCETAHWPPYLRGVSAAIVVRTMLLKFLHFARCCFTGSERAPAPSAAVQVLDNDDLLLEILLRLPPLPSSLPRASLVCKRWRRLIADPFFLHRFRQHHHGNGTPRPPPPPLLGYFFCHADGPVFVPTLAPPDRIPAERFSLPRRQPDGDRLFFLGCRHGLALLINRRLLQAIVWDPVTGCRATVAYPPEFTTDNGAHCCRGTVLGSTGAAATADDMRPFKVILIRVDDRSNGHILRVSMCVYDSQTGKWGRTVAIAIAIAIPTFVSNLPDVLVGNALCGFLRWPKGFLELDLERHSLGVIRTPAKRLGSIDASFFQVVKTQDGELGLATLTKLMSMELWGRSKACPRNGAARWVLQKTVQLDFLLPLPRRVNVNMIRILGFDEDSNVIHLSTLSRAFAIRLDSMQFTELLNISRIGCYHSCYPYTGFYAAGVPPRLSTA